MFVSGWIQTAGPRLQAQHDRPAVVVLSLLFKRCYFPEQFIPLATKHHEKRSPRTLI